MKLVLIAICKIICHLLIFKLFLMAGPLGVFAYIYLAAAWKWGNGASFKSNNRGDHLSPFM